MSLFSIANRELGKTIWFTRQVSFVFFRPTVKKFTKNCLGLFQMRENKKNNKKSVRKCLNYAFFVERQVNRFLIPLIIPAL